LIHVEENEIGEAKEGKMMFGKRHGEVLRDMFSNLQGRETAPEYSFGGTIGVLLYGMMVIDEVDDAAEGEVQKSLTRFVASKISEVAVQDMTPVDHMTGDQ
jgi:hypothetical protein